MSLDKRVIGFQAAREATDRPRAVGTSGVSAAVLKLCPDV